VSRRGRRGVLVAVLVALVVVVAAAGVVLVVLLHGDPPTAGRPVVGLHLGNAADGSRSLAVQVSAAGLDVGDTLDVRVVSISDADGSKTLEGRTVAQAASHGTVRADVSMQSPDADKVMLVVRTGGRTCTEYVSMSDVDDAVPAMTCVRS
jgi:hypothetical protein